MHDIVSMVLWILHRTSTVETLSNFSVFNYFFSHSSHSFHIWCLKSWRLTFRLLFLCDFIVVVVSVVDLDVLVAEGQTHRQHTHRLREPPQKHAAGCERNVTCEGWTSVSAQLQVGHPLVYISVCVRVKVRVKLDVCLVCSCSLSVSRSTELQVRHSFSTPHFLILYLSLLFPKDSPPPSLLCCLFFFFY